MKKILYFVVCLLVFAGCHKSSETTVKGKIQFVFNHTVAGNPLVMDSLIYRTATMHDYKVTDLQYFISDVILFHNGGQAIKVNPAECIHYVDLRMPSTLAWTPGDEIAPGTYDSLAFIFGINELENKSNRFPNPPERDMAWPDILGGGYHYMKMNLMYSESPGSVPKPFMLHLGIGQLYSSQVPDPDSITGYVQNYFSVALGCRFQVAAGVVSTIQCTMLVDRWFDGDVSFDFSDYPGGIMQYQSGMHKACLNGRKAFAGTVIN